MQITRNGSRPSGAGPTDWFTGRVRLDPLITAPEPARVAAALVTFEPGARTAWHGAGPETAMSHVAIQERQDGSAVTWAEHVSDADYNG